MVEGGGGAGFLDEAQTAVGVGDLVGAQDFDGDFAVELGVAGTVDDAHPTLSEFVEEFEVG